MSDGASTVRRLGWYSLVTVAIAAFAVAFVPGVAEAIPVDALLEAAGNDYFLLGAFGGLALLVVLVMLVRRATGTVTQAAPPDPETVRDAPRPGSEFDRQLASLSGAGDGLRERLHAATVGALVRREGIDRETARERVDAGRWTDNRVAAAFLGADRTSRPTLRDRGRAALRGERWAQYGARETARELTRRFDPETGGDAR